MSAEEAAGEVTSLFQSWGRSLHRYLLARTRDPQASEDIVQEAFLALYSHLIAGNGVENPRAWTLVVVRNLAAKYHREQARTTPMDAARADALPAAEHGVEADLHAIEALRCLLDLLTEREEEVLLLRMDALGYKEIARELSITPGTVATLLSRALGKMKRAYASGGAARTTAARRTLGTGPLQ